MILFYEYCFIYIDLHEYSFKLMQPFRIQWWKHDGSTQSCYLFGSNSSSSSFHSWLGSVPRPCDRTYQKYYHISRGYISTHHWWPSLWKMHHSSTPWVSYSYIVVILYDRNDNNINASWLLYAFFIMPSSVPVLWSEGVHNLLCTALKCCESRMLNLC